MSQQLIQEMQEYYERRAPVYDASMKYDDAATVAQLQPVIELLQAQMAGRCALEIACGPCFWTHFVSQTAVSILATDYNRSTLEQARQKSLDWEKVSLKTADAYNLAPLAQTFNAAYAVDWFAHVPRSRFHDFLGSLNGRLEPGAVVALCDQLPGPHSYSGLYDDEGNHLQQRTLPDGSRYRVIKHFLSDAELRDLFAPYSEQLMIKRFPDCRRIVVSYTL